MRQPWKPGDPVPEIITPNLDTRIICPLGDGVIAEVRFVGDPLLPKHIAALEGYLRVMQAVFAKETE